MQLFVRTLRGETAVVTFDHGDSLLRLKSRIQVSCGIPVELQRLRHGLTDVREEGDIRELQHGETVTLLLRLSGGKGGFGSLLRVQGRDTKATTNFEACRDLNGRRMRHVNAVKKMQEWQKNAKDRELEDIALKHIVEKARDIKRAKRAPIDRGVVQERQRKAVDDVKEAVQSALEQNKMDHSQRTKPPRFILDVDSDTESEASEPPSTEETQAMTHRDSGVDVERKPMRKRKRSR